MTDTPAPGGGRELVASMAHRSFARLSPDDIDPLREAIADPSLAADLYAAFGGYLTRLSADRPSDLEDLYVAVAELTMAGFWDRISPADIRAWDVLAIGLDIGQSLIDDISAYAPEAGGLVSAAFHGEYRKRQRMAELRQLRNAAVMPSEPEVILIDVSSMISPGTTREARGAKRFRRIPPQSAGEVLKLRLKEVRIRQDERKKTLDAAAAMIRKLKRFDR